MGTGEVPHPEEAEWCVVEVRAPDVLAEARAARRLLRLLPPDVVDALDRWDPEREALVLSPMFNELPEIAGRRVYGPRRSEGRRLGGEAVGGEGGAAPAEPGPAREPPGRLDRGAGTAWAGDASQGFSGGAFCVRWVRSPEDAAEAGGPPLPRLRRGRGG